MKNVFTFVILFSVIIEKCVCMFGSAEIFVSETNNSIGKVIFYQDPDVWGVVISGIIDHLRPNSTLGFHIHSGTIGNNHNCTNGINHFNPYNVSHGMPEDSILKRHVGDLGNIQTDVNGTVYIDFADPIISMIENNTRNIIDLSLMVHNLTDDGGHTGKGESYINGNSGPPIACGTIQRGA